MLMWYILNWNSQKHTVKTLYAIIGRLYTWESQNHASLDILSNAISFSQVCQREGAGISGLIVVMMSHGEQGSILDCDGNPVPIQDIINQMNPAFLDGKPKVCITYIYIYIYTPILSLDMRT